MLDKSLCSQSITEAFLLLNVMGRENTIKGDLFQRKYPGIQLYLKTGVLLFFANN